MLGIKRKTVDEENKQKQIEKNIKKIKREKK